ncbi:unknown protein [Desulfotalea psychrophila LSv54]|uniref:Uncharacterized protein n=1 Tax=Desulfotalea psychrophila (strain LSv54 / DSM 12343) TaxID=177439 RepID=Q6AKS0_DESPS|nr:unknown protein [Desulfotalea psychrophila LSv54]
MMATVIYVTAINGLINDLFMIFFLSYCVVNVVRVDISEVIASFIPYLCTVESNCNYGKKILLPLIEHLRAEWREGRMDRNYPVKLLPG